MTSSKLVKLFRMINSLDKKNLSFFLKLSPYQNFVLSRLVNKKPLSAQDILNSPIRLSKAQKYRYIKDLIKKQFIKKKYNEYFIS